MTYKEIIEKYQGIRTENKDCEASFNERYKQLTDKISNSLGNYTIKEHSKRFSDLFDIWLVATAAEHDFNIIIEEKKLDVSDEKSHNIFSIAKKEKVSKLLDTSSTSKTDELYKSRKIIEYALTEHWSHLFKTNLESLSISNQAKDNYAKSCFMENKDFHKHWSLYELINQINKTLDKMTEDGKSINVNISKLEEDKKDSIIANSEILCSYILETYILGSTKYKDTNIWLPDLTTKKEITLPHIIATSDLVSYIFNHRLMTTKDKNRYLLNVKNAVTDIHKNTFDNNYLYEKMVSYFTKCKEDQVLTYKAKLLSPKLVLLFVIVAIQEIVKKSLTQARYNIFFILNQKFRDKGITEESILSKIKKDIKTYNLILHYFEKPVKATIVSKKEKLNIWLETLKKLRLGVLDECLSDLAEATQISIPK